MLLHSGWSCFQLCFFFFLSTCSEGHFPVVFWLFVANSAFWQLSATLSLHCKTSRRQRSARRFCVPILGNRDLRRAIGRCVFDASETLMPASERSGFCIKRARKSKSLFWQSTACQRSGSAAKAHQTNLRGWVLYPFNLFMSQNDSFTFRNILSAAFCLSWEVYQWAVVSCGRLFSEWVLGGCKCDPGLHLFRRWLLRFLRRKQSFVWL